MEVEVGEVAARPLGELGDRADARVGAAVVAAPHRQRRAPEAVARQRPVDVVLEPVAEAPVLDVLGVPADGLVLARAARRWCADGAREPGGLRPVDERRVAAPAVRVGVRVARPRCSSDRPRRASSMIAGSASFTNVPAHGCGTSGCRRTSPRADRVEHRQALGVGDLAVDLAERGREVHDARAVVDGDEVGGHDPRRPRRRRSRELEEVEGPLVAEPDEVVDRDRADDLGVVAEHVGDARRRHHEVAAPPSPATRARTRRRDRPRRRRSTPASTAWWSTRGGRSRGRRRGSARRPTAR